MTYEEFKNMTIEDLEALAIQLKNEIELAELKLSIIQVLINRTKEALKE